MKIRATGNTSGWKELYFGDIIGEVGLFVDGDWIESKDQDPKGNIRLIQLADVGDGVYLNRSRRFLTSEKATELNCTFLAPGDLLIARMPDPVGRACIFPGDEKDSVAAVDICIVRPDPNIACTEWLKHAVNYGKFRSLIKQYISGTTRDRISRKNLEKISVLLPPLGEQERIASILDKADAIRHSRQLSCLLAKELLNAVFLKMFGDPVENKMGWNYVTMEDIAADKKYSIVDGPFGSSLKFSDYHPDGIPIIRIQNISADGQFIDKDFLYISQQKYEELRRSAVQKGDILISRVGTLGNTCIYPGTYNKALLSTTGVCKITIDDKKANKIFLHRLIMTDSFQRQIASSASSSVQKYFNLTALKKWKLILPPLCEQERYATFVERQKQLFECIIQQNEDIFNLYQSLSQSAFRGEL